jgi:hypothetical protein
MMQLEVQLRELPSIAEPIQTRTPTNSKKAYPVGSSPLKKGTGTSHQRKITIRLAGRSAPVPFFNRLLEPALCGEPFASQNGSSRPDAHFWDCRTAKMLTLFPQV